MKTQIAQRKEKGAALVEFALTVPFLFFFVSAIVEFGNILSQLTWISQAGYHIASVGAQSPQAVAEALMGARLNQLRSAKDFERFRNRIEITSIEAPGGEFFDNLSTARTVSVLVRANIKPISSVNVSVPVSIEVTAPQLVLRSQYNPNYAQFGQPEPDFFNCDYARIGTSPNSSACRPSSSCTRSALPGNESCA